MINAFKKIHVLMVGLFLTLVTFGYLPDSVGQVPPAPPGHGAIPLTAAQRAKFHKSHFRIKSVHLNQLGLSRINMERAKKHLPLLDQIAAMPMGQDIEGVNDFGAAKPQPNTIDQLVPKEALATSHAGMSSLASPAASVTLPSAVDNSAEVWFPPIGNQGYLGSCTAFSTTYYQFTYMTAMSKGWTVSNGDTTKIFSPKWTYNMNNGGSDSGSYDLAEDDVLTRSGAATLAQFPYDNNYLAWDMNSSDWLNALSFRANSVQFVESASANASDITTWITQIKQLLNNGYILTFDTTDPQMGQGGWQYTTVTNDTVNPSIVGQHVAYMVTGTVDHSMTIVGYDDTLQWSYNGVTGTGAFKIANQWGNSNSYGMNAGFFWLAYDAVYPVSQIAGGPASSGRNIPIANYEAYELSVRPNYTPKVVAEFTLNTLLRGEVQMTLGTGATTASSPASIYYPPVFDFDGGPYAFNGTTTAVPGTFYLDFTDYLPSTPTAQNYFLGVDNNTSEGCVSTSGFLINCNNPVTPTTLSSYQLIDLTTNTTNTATSLPGAANNSLVYASIKYAFNTHVPPTASATMTPASGTAPLTVNFNASASSDTDGTITAYGWNFGDGTTGTGITASHIYSTAGTFNAVLTVTDNDGATGTYNLPVITVSAPATVAPKITSQPVSVTVTAPTAAAFSVTATGTPTPAYQWEVSTNGGSSWTVISGATSATYTISTTTASLSGNEYEVVVSNGVSPSAISNVALLTVNPMPVAPSITTQPVSATVTAPASVTFTAAASGTPVPTYQWEVSTNGGSSWSAISGATSASYTISSTTSSLNGNEYEVVASNGVLPAATSNPATLTVNPTLVAPSITTQPVSATVTAPASVTFTAAASGTPVPTYQWEVSTNGGTSWSALSGATSPSYTISSTTSSLNGNEYEVVASNGVLPAATSNPATLTVNPTPVAPSITTQPVSATVTAPASVTFTAAASGTPVPTYQWEVRTNGGNSWSVISGATSASYTISSTTSSLNGNEYEVVASNGVLPAATSNPATLTVNPTPVAPSITTQPVSATVTAPASVTFTAAASGTPVPTYQWEVRTNGGSSWSVISGATSASYTISSTTSSLNGNEYEVVASNGVSPAATSNPATLTVNPTLVAPSITTQPVSVTVTAPAAVTFTAAASGTPVPTYQWEVRTNGGSSWSAISGATSASYTISSTTSSLNGNEYEVVASNGVLPAATSNPATLTVNPTPVAPSITTQPVSVTVTAPATATFRVVATGTPAPTYQWMQNVSNLSGTPEPRSKSIMDTVVSSWTPISGATSSSYTTPATTGANSGTQYECVVSNGVSPSVTSNAVTLTVNSVLSAPVGLTAAGGNSNVVLSWTATSGATSYDVKRATVSGGPYTTIANPVSNNYTDNSVSYGTTYYYVVSALNAAGTSPNSLQVSATPIDTTPPSVPTNLAASVISASQINLSWNASSDSVGVTSYSIYRNGTKVATSTTNSYADIGLAANTTYTYTVSALDTAGNSSAQSSSVTATTLALPASLSVSAISSTNTMVAPDDVINVYNTVTNAGSSQNSAFEVVFHLAHNNQFGASNDIVLSTTRTISSLNAAASSTANSEMVVPVNTPAGSYYLCAAVSLQTGNTHTVLANSSRCASSVLKVQLPELAMTAVKTPLTAVSGGVIPVSYTVQNQGPGNAHGFYIQFYLSTTATITTADTVVGTGYFRSLAAGSSNSGTLTWYLPSALAPGTYYIGAIANYNGAMEETNTLHNTLAGNTITISNATGSQRPEKLF